MPTEPSAFSVLRELAARGATGTVQVTSDCEQGCVRLRDGLMVDAVAPSGAGSLGLALVGAGVLSAQALHAVLDGPGPLAETELADRLVGRGDVAASSVDEVVRHRLVDALAELLAWPAATWTLVDSADVDEGVAGMSVETLLCGAGLESGGPAAAAEAVPVAADVGAPVPLTLPPAGWSLLCALDGRTVAQLAAHCGIGVHRAGTLVAELARAGVVDVRRPPRRQLWATSSAPPADLPDPAGTAASAAPGHEAALAGDRIAAWRTAAIAEARAVAAEHARMSAEFEAYEEYARRDADAQAARAAEAAARLSARRTLAEIAAYAEAQRLAVEPAAHEEHAQREVAAAEGRRVAAAETDRRRSAVEWERVQAQRRAVVAATRRPQ